MNEAIATSCCISGGGPAGVMLGFLLARAGIDVVVLEKWPDFFRDFRGDTIHPSVMEILHELGLLEGFLQLPHDEVKQVEADIGTEKVVLADFSRLDARCPFLGFIPQWDFLNFIVSHAKEYPGFKMMMETEAIDLLKENGKVTGVLAKRQGQTLEIRSELVVGADGRHSTVREKGGLVAKSFGAPMDVLWFRVSRKETDPPFVLGKVDMGKMMVMVDRGDYWQCGFIIRKGAFDVAQRGGLEVFQRDVIEVAPALADRIHEIDAWDKVKLLTVAVDRLLKWHCPGLLCIGDSAHAMSPIGGVGINLAIQDAVAAANILVEAFRRGISERDLAAVQARRELPTKIIQRIQVFIQNRIISRILEGRGHPRLPWQLKLLKRFPYLRRWPAYMIGIGFRPEHVDV